MNKPCDMCGGTGQRCYFKGESRFLLSWEECPACCGTGYESATTDSALDGTDAVPLSDTEPRDSTSQRAAGDRPPDP